MRVDKKRGFRTALSFQLRLHAFQLLAGFFNRSSESIDFLPHLIGPQLEIERCKKWIEGADGFSDRDAHGSHDAMNDPFFLHSIRHSFHLCYPVRYSQMLSTASSSSTP